MKPEQWRTFVSTAACIGFSAGGAELLTPGGARFRDLLGVLMVMAGGYLLSRVFKYAGTLRRP